MSATEETEQTETMNGGETVYRVTDPEAMRFVSDDGGAATLEGKMMPYGQWTEIRSSVEGHFLERFLPGAFAKTMSERASKVRVLFEHGLDRSFGRQTIAQLQELSDEADGAYFRATLLDGLPPLLVSGLQRGLYGSSVRFDPVKWDRVRYPRRSEHNPDGLEERTIRESGLREVSITAFPAYDGTTANVRSFTDEVAARQLLVNPERLLEIITKQTTVEPQHSEPATPPEDPALVGSRRTQPIRDYLQPQEAEPRWLL